MIKPELKTIRLSEITFDEVVYPRKDHDPVLVQRYTEVIDEIESAQKFISVSSDYKLLDGKHRWLAYRKRNGDTDQEIKVLVYNVSAPHDQLKIAAQLNSDHGWQLSSADKESTAKSLYAYGATYEDIASTLSVGKALVTAWLSRTVKENRDKRNAKIFDLWMACHTNEDISTITDTPKGTVDRLLGHGDESLLQKVLQNQTKQTLATFSEPEWDPPIYNVWKQQTKTAGSSHFGNSETRWLENLLYLYTDPFDIVVDPFAGGGSTIDLCKKRGRRYFVSDRKPIVEREHEIRCHDIIDLGAEGTPPKLRNTFQIVLPKIPRWNEVKLVYLDPPYWKQAEGKYSDHPGDFGNMTLGDFSWCLHHTIMSFKKKMSDGSHIALIIQPTQWNAPDKQYTDHAADMIRAIDMPIYMRFQCPYESQQANAQMVEWSKANKTPLVLSREMIVWRVRHD